MAVTSHDAAQRLTRHVDDTPGPRLLPLLGQEAQLACGLAAGCFTVAWSAALLDFFLRYCNAPRGPITTELGRSAYAVYVIHPLIVVPLVAAYLAILRGPWETEVDFPPGTSKSSTPMAEGKLVLGFATVMPLSLVLTWTVASGFRRLPVLRDIF